MIGQTISHYKILEKLGEGGMGIVYKAEDIKLHRPVALKVLPRQALITEEDKIRFAREARAAASLSHPNVAMIHEFDEVDDPSIGGKLSFIAMEYVDGETVKKKIQERPLPIPEAVNIAIAVAEGLAKAHERGVVHRDIKSENVMISKDGMVKIMDFGLAEIAGRSRVTREGMTVGTLAYMSPEQALGEKLDQRTDIWSLGVVLYEMLSGSMPFRGDYDQAIIYQILHQTPTPLTGCRPDISPRLEQVVIRAMQRDVVKRYQFVGEFLTDLKALRKGIEGAYPAQATIGDGHERNRIAILPFVNISPDARDEYFADGMTEELIANLSKINKLRVIARTSVMRYKGTSKSIAEIARELKVGTVLEGSVRKAAERVRITVQLIDGNTEEHLWSQDYDRTLDDIFGIQSDIAGRVAEALKLQLGAGEARQIAQKPTVNVEAYEYYLRGIYHYKKSKIDNDIAIMMLERAVELDPEFAPAHAALAEAYTEKFLNYEAVPSWEQKASKALERALALDATLAEAYVAKGILLWTLNNGFPHEQAIAAYKRAIELKPNLEEAHSKLALVYFHIGLLDKAIAHLQTALEINPSYLYACELLGMTYVYLGRYSEALTLLQKIPHDMDPDWIGSQIILALVYLDRRMDAMNLLKERLLSCPTSSWLLSTEAILLAQDRKANEAEDRIRRAIEHGKQLGHFHHTMHHIAAAYAIMGKRQPALEWLRRAADDGLPCHPLFESDPNLLGLRGDPQFDAFLDELREDLKHYQETL